MPRRPRLARELERYLVEGETVIVAVRRHRFHLVREVALAVAATALAIWVDVRVPRSPGGEVLQNLALVLWWAAAGWLVWRYFNWRHDWFVATDKRFLLFYGFIRRKVAMMPLQKVTDMTYDRSLVGRIVGFGTFVLESAGQDQALSVINHVPDSDRHYKAICTQLFGSESQVRVHSRGFAPPPPEDDENDGNGGAGPGGDDDGDGGGGGNEPETPWPAGDPPPAVRAEDPEDPTAPPAPTHRPESWYRSSNLLGATHLGDTGEIPVVRARPDHEDDADVPLYPPRHWSP